MADLDNKIRAIESEFDVTKDFDMKFRKLIALSDQLSERFASTNKLEDLQDCIRLSEKALESIPDSSSTKFPFRLVLSYSLFIRFKLFGRNRGDLDTAILITVQALDGARRPDNSSVTDMLDLLGKMLYTRYDEGGLPDDLENSIKNARRAIAFSSQGDKNMVTRLKALGGYLAHRFGETHRMQDLDEAIQLGLRAETLTTETDSEKPEILRLLCDLYATRYSRTRAVEDFEVAYSKIEAGRDLVSDGSPGYSSYMDSVSNILGIGFRISHDMQYLTSSIEAGRMAISSAPERKPYFLDNLSRNLSLRFKETRHMEDLDEAIELQTESVNIQTANRLQQTVNQPAEAESLLSLGWLKSDRFDVTKDERDCEGALTAYLGALNCVISNAWVRIWAAHGAIKFLNRKKSWSESWNIANKAVRLLPSISQRSLEIDDKCKLLTAFNGLPALACSLAMEVGKNLVEAIDILEIGRGAIFGQEIDMKISVASLAAKHPFMAAKYEKLRAAIRKPIDSHRTSRIAIEPADHLNEKDEEFERYIQKIRQMEGFENFAGRPSLAELKQLGSEGPIVVVNVSEFRSDAIMVTSSGLSSSSLLKMTADDTVKWSEKNLTHFDLPEQYISNNPQYREFLAWLWVTCVQPVLSVLEKKRRGTDSTPFRIWWIGTGIANNFPFHGAGTISQSPDCADSTLSRAISSYIPTIKALSYARSRLQPYQRMMQSTTTATKDKGRRAEFLSIAMPSTPGQDDLEYVGQEVKEIQSVLESHCGVTTFCCPSVAKVLEAMPLFDVVHFACHGFPDVYNPLDSYLVLQKIENSGDKPVLVKDLLKVREILTTELRRARIAFLSACSSAENAAEDLEDEAIEISSGFLIAGFSHVIGTKWSTIDTFSIEFAKEFYQRLDLGLESDADAGGVARANHDAVLKLRSRHPKQPLGWAPYIHMGI